MWAKLKPFIVPAYFVFWIGYFAYFWFGLFTYDAAGNLQAGHVNVWGDWAAHFTMGSAMGYRELLLTQSPFIVGERFSYPFLTNLISGLLIRGGVPFLMAFVIPSFLFSIALIASLFYFFKTLFNSQKIALIASLIFLFNGGLGSLYFISDISMSSDPWQTLLNPPHEYTRIDEEGIKWLSVIDSMIIPQRAFTLGFPVTLLALTWIYSYFFSSRPRQPSPWYLGAAGLLLGLMPIIHTHSFLSACIILGFWFLADLLSQPKQWRSKLPAWIGLFIIVVLVAMPLYSYFFMNRVTDFIQWYPGWLAREFEMNWFLFWFKNWTVTPLLALVGFWFMAKTTSFQVKKILIFTPFIVLFGLANVWLFQPFAWDNTKLIVWSAVGISGLVAWLFTAKWRTLLNKSVITFLFLMIISAGAIDAYRILRFELHRYQLYSAEELELAEWVKHQTDPEAIWLTGTHHNHWLFNLTGRQSVMTYPGWLWTHGYQYSEVEQAVRTMYKQPNNVSTFETYDVTYIVVGPQERKEMLANVASFRQHFEVIKETANYVVFMTSPTQPAANNSE